MNENIKIIDKIKEMITNDKEVLSVLPQNNVRNRKKYIEKLEELINKYNNYKNDVYERVNNNYEKLINVAENTNLNIKKDKALGLSKYFYLFNEYNTSYEKMGLDVIIYNLRKYYKDNLETVNNNILDALNKFENVGVKLVADDFFYSIYVHEYMQVFINEKNNGDIHSNVIKEEFEKVYWKCPDLIKHVVMNLLYLYYKNKKQIDKYYVELRKNIEMDLGCFDAIVKEYDVNFSNYKFDLETDKYIILNKFLSEELNINDYTDDKIHKLITQLYENEISNDSLYESLYKLRYSLFEYKKFMSYEYLVNEIKEIYNEKDKYKNAFKNKYKEISKKESLIKKLNGKLKWLMKRNKLVKIENINNQINLTINELDKLYLELDMESFKEKVLLNIDADSTLYDVLKLSSSYYNFLVESNKKAGVEVNALTLISDLEEFIYNSKNTLIQNLLFNSEENKAMIVSDKYKLMNFNVEIDMLDINNIDSLINMVSSIIFYFNILKTGYTIDELIFVCQAKKICDKGNVAS